MNSLQNFRKENESPTYWNILKRHHSTTMSEGSPGLTLLLIFCYSYICLNGDLVRVLFLNVAYSQGYKVI